MDDVPKILNVVVEKENLRDCKIHIDNSQKVVGFIGLVKFVRVEGTNQEGENKVLDLVVKYAPKSNVLRTGIKIKEAFRVENYHYAVVHPTYRKLQEDHGVVDPFTSMAKCYVTCDEEYEESLVLENLRIAGFSIFDKDKKITKDHIALAMKTYGKLHALSFALREIDEKKYVEITTNLQNDVFYDFISKSQEILKKQWEDILVAFDETTEERTLKKLKDCKDCIHSFFMEVSREVDEYSIISHGDCWQNNIMFKYDDEDNPEKPTSIIFIDWQCTRPSSPVLDLSYFFYCSGRKEMFDDLNRYLKIYYDSFSNHLRQFGCDPDELFPFSKFEEHWKRYCKYGLFLALMSVKVLLADREDAPDLEAAAESGKSSVEAFAIELSHEEEYLERMKDIMVHFIDRDFL